MDTGKLLSVFMNACARAGVSSSGLVIDLSGSDDLGNAHYLRGVIHARIDRATPPFHPRDRVKAKTPTVTPSPSNNWERDRRPRDIKEVLTVAKVFYLGNRGWDVSFRGSAKETADTVIEYEQDGRTTFVFPLHFRTEDFELLVPLEAIHRQVLEHIYWYYYNASRDGGWAPTHLSSQLKLPLEDTMRALGYLADASYLKQIDPWFRIQHEEDKHCYEYV